MGTDVRPVGPDVAPHTRRPVHRAPVLLAVVVVALQLTYPLLHGGTRDAATVAIVVLFALTCTVHAAVTRGPAFAVAVLVVTAGVGLAVEQLGVHTGVPFGSYSYGPGLGPRWAGVPLVIALAWTMLAWPAAVAARALVRDPVARVVVGAWAFATADLFLDPQMVRAGYWTWASPTPHLPGVGTVPLANYVGWLLAGAVVSAALQALLALAPGRHDDRVPLALYLWLWVGWVVALGAFLHLPAAAAWGAVGMGTVAVPLAASLARQR